MRRNSTANAQNPAALGTALLADPSIVMLGAKDVGGPATLAEDAVVTTGALRDGRGNVGMINDKGNAAVFQPSSPVASDFPAGAISSPGHAMEAFPIISLLHGNILILNHVREWAETSPDKALTEIGLQIG